MSAAKKPTNPDEYKADPVSEADWLKQFGVHPE